MFAELGVSKLVAAEYLAEGIKRNFQSLRDTPWTWEYLYVIERFTGWEKLKFYSKGIDVMSSLVSRLSHDEK